MLSVVTHFPLIPNPVAAADTQCPRDPRRQKSWDMSPGDDPFQPGAHASLPWPLPLLDPSGVHSDSESNSFGLGHFIFRIYQEPRG